MSVGDPGRFAPRRPREPLRLQRLGALAALGALCPLVLSPATAAGQSISGAWDADERVLVTDFQRVTALARSSDRLFAATDGGLVVRSEAFERWELPITREDGYPDSQVLALGFDRRDGSLWMATRDGRLLQFDVFSRRWLDGFSVQGAINRIIAPSTDPSVLFVLRGDRWLALDPFTRDLRSADPAEVQRAVDADFDLRARQELLADARWEAARPFLGRRGQERYEITDVVPASGGAGGFWVATYGGFLERYDNFSGGSEPLEYGLVGIGAAAVLVHDGTAWFAPAYASDRYGVAAAGPDLEEWRTWAGVRFGFDDRGAPDAAIRAWLGREDGVWAGGDRGLHRFDGETWHGENMGRRADVAAITALAEGPDGLEGIWVGTERGLLRIPTSGAGPDAVLLGAERVRALAAHAGALWIGTDAGLVRLDSGGAAMPEARAGPPGRVGALASDGTSLYAGIERDVWVLAPGAEWERAAPLGVLAARASALTVRDGVVWIGTAEGITAWDTRDDRVTTFTFAAGDLPTGPRGERDVVGLAVEEGGRVWAATPAGAVRIDPGW